MNNSIEDELKVIQHRNEKVELDKAWETSFVRRGFIACMTYIIAVWFMWSIGVENHYLNAFVPTGGYILSTLSLPFIKKRWIKNKK